MRADIALTYRDVRFWHKQNSEMHCTCPLSGVKRTCASALQMSAFGAKAETWLPP